MSGSGGEVWRCFVAVDVDDGARVALEELTDELGRHGADVRWVRAQNLHLTLKFLGDVSVDRVDEVRTALSPLAPVGPLQLTLSGLGRFPPPGRGRPRVFWVGVQGDVDGLVQLAGAADDALAPLGFARERRPFSPHLTLGRVRGSRGLRELEEAVEQRSFDRALRPIHTFRLYRSTLTPGGAIYDTVETFGGDGDT